MSGGVDENDWQRGCCLSEFGEQERGGEGEEGLGIGDLLGDFPRSV